MLEKKTVLIVEDDESIIEMYREKLKLGGYRVLTARNGRIALSRIKENPDLVLLDILMPGLNGFEVLKRIKKEETIKKIPVIVLTNVGSESFDNDKKLALSLGASDYLIKSLNTPDSIAEKVAQII